MCLWGIWRRWVSGHVRILIILAVAMMEEEGGGERGRQMYALSF